MLQNKIISTVNLSSVEIQRQHSGESIVFSTIRAGHVEH